MLYFTVNLMLKHKSILFTNRNLYFCKLFSYILVFFDVSETVSRVLQVAFKKVSRMIQEAPIN